MIKQTKSVKVLPAIIACCGGDDFLLSWLITRTCFVPRSDVVMCKLATSETVSSLSVMATGYNSVYYVHKHPPMHVCAVVRAQARTRFP